MKRQVIRTCIACRKKIEIHSHAFIRVSKPKDSESVNFEINTSNNIGRGCYICKNKNCIEKVSKNNLLKRAFRANIDKNVYNKILKLI